MLTKTKIALSALLVAGFASSALAADMPPVVDRYPVGNHTVQLPAGASAFASATVLHPVKPFTAAERALFERTSRLGNQ